MDVRDALHEAVLGYPGGVTALSARMGLAESTLRNMANPNGEHNNPWSLARLRQVLAYCPSRLPIHALAEEAGGVFVPVVLPAEATLPDLYQQVTKLAAEFGDVVREVQQDARDGRITPRELGRIDKQIAELIEAAAALRQVAARSAEPVRLQVAKA